MHKPVPLTSGALAHFFKESTPNVQFGPSGGRILEVFATGGTQHSRHERGKHSWGKERLQEQGWSGHVAALGPCEAGAWVRTWPCGACRDLHVA